MRMVYLLLVLVICSFSQKNSSRVDVLDFAINYLSSKDGESFAKFAVKNSKYSDYEIKEKVNNYLVSTKMLYFGDFDKKYYDKYAITSHFYNILRDSTGNNGGGLWEDLYKDVNFDSLVVQAPVLNKNENILGYVCYGQKAEKDFSSRIEHPLTFINFFVSRQHNVHSPCVSYYQKALDFLRKDTTLNTRSKVAFYLVMRSDMENKPQIFETYLSNICDTAFVDSVALENNWLMNNRKLTKEMLPNSMRGGAICAKDPDINKYINGKTYIRKYD